MKDNLQEAYSIFQQPWWLETVAPGSWDQVTAVKGEEVRGRLPYLKTSRMGITLSMLPPLTPHLGPWIKPSEGKYANRLSNEKRVLDELIQGLPKFDYFKQNFNYHIENWLPFYWAGFSQTTRYTYVLDDISDPDKVWEGIQGNIRREIKKARKQVSVEETSDIEELWKLHRLTFERQNSETNHSKEEVKRVADAVTNRNSGKIFIARDSDEKPHAAILVVWDQQSAFYLLGGADPELRNSGASSLLLWHAIQYVANKTRKFDFEGSMLKPIERFFRGFGAHQKRYFQITRMSKRMRLLKGSFDIFKSVFKG